MVRWGAFGPGLHVPVVRRRSREPGRPEELGAMHTPKESRQLHSRGKGKPHAQDGAVIIMGRRVEKVFSGREARILGRLEKIMHVRRYDRALQLQCRHLLGWRSLRPRCTFPFFLKLGSVQIQGKSRACVKAQFRE